MLTQRPRHRLKGVFVNPGKLQRGASMIEVLVAMLLFSIGVVGLLRTLGTAVTDTGAVQYRSTAASLADGELGLMWADSANLAAYASTGIDVPQLPNGKRDITINDNIVTVKISWQAPGSSAPSSHQVVATITSN